MRAIFTRRVGAPAVLAVAVTAVLAAGTAAQAAPQAPAAAAASASSDAGARPAYTPPSGFIDPCPQAAPGDAGCAALISKPTASATAAASSADRSASRTGAAAVAVTPSGYGPAQLQQAYGFHGATGGSGQTVAIVTAYNPADAASDLAAYRSQYGLAPCTVADGCLEQVSQTGSTTSLPSTDAGWDAPVAESADMISAICPNCHILLVEANSSAISDLGTAENEAVTLGATFIDNDWVIPEAQISSEETTYDTDYFDHPGVAITAPAGDDGYGTINYPAASQYVTAVGGTTLTADSGVARGYTETAWSGSSSGCSAYEPKPSWQTDTGCADRTLNDLAADADPATAVAYYDTPTAGGWDEGSGTVVAAAIIAASYAMAGTPASGTYPAAYPYEYPGGAYTTPGNAYTAPDGLYNITSGSDGTCSVTYLCTAGAGYNGPTGLGTPNGNLSLTSSGETGEVQVHTAAGICLDGENAGPVPEPALGPPLASAPADLNSCSGSQSQTWALEPNGTISDTIDVQVTPGEGDGARSGPYSACLSTEGATTTGSPVDVQTGCHYLGNSGSPSEQWELTAANEVINPASGLCLTDPGGATGGGTALELQTCASTPATDQQWTAPYDRPTATGPVKSKITTADLCLDDANDATTNGNKIQVWTCLGNANQKWAVTADGTLQLSGESGCATPDNDGTVNATAIVYHSCDGDPSQQWTEESDGSLLNTRSGLCLADPDASTTNGTAAQLSPCNSQVQQTWTLP